jgi:tetratricopeptide (TPR) repeat protein
MARRQLFQRDENERALADFNAAQRLDPKDNEVYWQRGQVYEVARDFKAALTDYSEYLYRQRNSVRGYIRRAIVRLALGDPDHALGDTSDALYIEPRNPVALEVRGNAYRTKGDLVRAIDDYTAAITFGPGFAQVYHERGVAYRMKGDRENAITEFKMAIRLQPMDSSDSRAELKALGIKVPEGDPMRHLNAKDVLDSLRRARERSRQLIEALPLG